jgi:hypothetical protein
MTAKELLNEVRQTWRPPPRAKRGTEADCKQWPEIQSRTANTDLHVDTGILRDGRAQSIVNSSHPMPNDAVRVHIPEGMSRGDAAKRLFHLSLYLNQHDNWHEFFNQQPKD